MKYGSLHTTQPMGGMVSMACLLWVNSLWPGDTIWWHRFGSTLAQVMACCLTAPSHYLNQYWVVIKGVPWNSSECNFSRSDHELIHNTCLDITLFEITAVAPRAQWVKILNNVPHLSIKCCMQSTMAMDTTQIMNYQRGSLDGLCSVCNGK